MKQTILKYYNPALKIAMGKWNQAYLIASDKDNAIELIPEYYKGCLIYRVPKTSKIFSYKKVKKQLIAKIIQIPENKLPF